MAAIAAAKDVAAELIPARTPRSADVRNTEVLRIAVGGAALVLLGVRRYGFRRPPLLGPKGQLVATGATVFMGYPFFRGALRSLRSGRAGTDTLVTAATVASMVLRENVVALTVLWLLNIGEYLQDLTLRRTRRAIADLLRGTTRTRPGSGPMMAAKSRCPSIPCKSVTRSSSTITWRSRWTARCSTGKRWSTSRRSRAKRCRSAWSSAPAYTPDRW
ncbi:hypothetical protein MTIM_36010 [Mycobacterium timonense]|uniref:Uncharacterized protein n=1 Tax=Mycobacterium timonense TaxID=701043 RepID=A0A7I9ZA38_9MYCO|nr:hypothetical protein MTIM_36010 [Mycobacterium timonense]